MIANQWMTRVTLWSGQYRSRSFYTHTLNQPLMRRFQAELTVLVDLMGRCATEFCTHNATKRWQAQSLHVDDPSYGSCSVGLWVPITSRDDYFHVASDLDHDSVIHISERVGLTNSTLSPKPLSNADRFNSSR